MRGKQRIRAGNDRKAQRSTRLPTSARPLQLCAYFAWTGAHLQRQIAKTCVSLSNVPTDQRMADIGQRNVPV